MTTEHRLGRKGNSNNRDLEYRDFTVFEPAVTRKGLEMDFYMNRQDHRTQSIAREREM
jgi:hypothetical protein